MKNSYRLKNIRKTVAYDEICLSAAIWHDNREIGSFRDCPDTGKPILEFKQAEDRISFEEYIQSWWHESDRIALCNLHLRELVDRNVAHELPVNTKIRCWIVLETGSMQTDGTWKWQPKATRYLMRSY